MVGPAIEFFKKLELWQNKENVEDSNEPEPGVCVARILSKSKKGKLILKHYNERKTLSSQVRRELSSVIVEYLLQKELKPRQNLLKEIANRITDIFDSETADTYFLKSKGKKPGGLLYSHYYNIKAKYSTGKVPKPLNQNVSPNMLLSSQKTEVELDLQWLKYNIEPLESVLRCWNSTFDWRSNFLKSDANLLDVFEEFPILTQSFGFKLIENDFEALYPASFNNFSQKWDEFKSKIVPLLREKVKEQQGKILLKSLESNGEDIQTTLIWLAIHSVLVPTSRTKADGDSKTFKHTIADSRGRFLVWKATVGELQTHLKNLTENCYSGKQKLQPFICSVGTSPFYLTEFSVYLSGVFYRMPNLLRSIEVCFKIFFVLNLEYPPECTLVWSLIQQHFYEIHLKSDKKSKALSELLNDFKNFRM
ncbi:uncharacterized protein LOC119558375 [Drosophila subpulchrella]|uniref:uncharacterized protein LOC119558375 n=1 Tax=Drosophila subpulchrella TaxID=1486046 RepID=UPI0018A1AF2D|nr:uncharacterized protein LOC119558375 [Drosophila subpulchrella]